MVTFYFRYFVVDICCKSKQQIGGVGGGSLSRGLSIYDVVFLYNSVKPPEAIVWYEPFK